MRTISSRAKGINGPAVERQSTADVFIDLMRPDVPYDYSETDTVYAITWMHKQEK